MNMYKNKLFFRGFIGVLIVSFFVIVAITLQHKDNNFFRFNSTIKEKSLNNSENQSATVLSATLNDGLIAYYKFDESSGTTVADSSGNNNNGMLKDGATAWTVGKIKNAFNLNLTNNYLTSSKVLPLFTEFTVSTWVKVNDLRMTRGIFTTGGKNGTGFRFRINTDGSVWILMAGGGSFDTLSTKPGLIQEGVSYYHIAVEGKSRQDMRIYINGVLTASKTTTQIIDPSSSAGYIGSSWGTGLEMMNGVIDEFRIYNRALSNEEIASLAMQTQSSSASSEISSSSYSSSSSSSQPSSSFLKGSVGAWTWNWPFNRASPERNNLINDSLFDWQIFKFDDFKNYSAQYPNEMANSARPIIINFKRPDGISKIGLAFYAQNVKSEIDSFFSNQVYGRKIKGVILDWENDLKDDSGKVIAIDHSLALSSLKDIYDYTHNRGLILGISTQTGNTGLYNAGIIRKENGRFITEDLSKIKDYADFFMPQEYVQKFGDTVEFRKNRLNRDLTKFQIVRNSGIPVIALSVIETTNNPELLSPCQMYDFYKNILAENLADGFAVWNLRKINNDYIRIFNAIKEKNKDLNCPITSSSSSSSSDSSSSFSSSLSQFQKNIEKASRLPVLGTWEIAGGSYGIDSRGIINNNADVEKIINQYIKYGLNTILLRYENLADTSGNLSEKGKSFLRKTALSNIRLILNFSDNFGFTSENWTPNRNVKSFLVSLDEYRQSYDVNGKDHQADYDNILAYFLSTDVSGTRINNVMKFADYFRNEIYHNSIRRELDIPLMIKTVMLGDANEAEKFKNKKIDEKVEIIGFSNYPFLNKNQEKNSEILVSQINRLPKGSSGENFFDKRFYTQPQTHNEFWYNVMFYGSSPSDKSPQDPYPDGVQVSSLIYQTLQAGIKKFVIFQAPYLKTTLNVDYSKDRLAEIGLVNKLILSLWNPIIKDAHWSKVNNTTSTADLSNRFFGSTLNFKDTTNDTSTLFVISNTKSNYIQGDSSANNVSFDLENIGVNLSNPNLKVVKVQFPKIEVIPFVVQYDKLTVTIPSVYDNALVLITSDQTLISQINQNLSSESVNAKALLREAFEGRWNKTDKEIIDMRDQGFVLDDASQILYNNIKSKLISKESLSHEKLRQAISQIGDLQILIYKRVHNISADSKIVYPDAHDYEKSFYNCSTSTDNNDDSNCFKDKVPGYLNSCQLQNQPQKMHFYLLSEYIRDCVKNSSSSSSSSSSFSSSSSNSSSSSSSTSSSASSLQPYFNLIYNKPSATAISSFILTKVNLSDRSKEEIVKRIDTATFGITDFYHFKLNNGDDAVVYAGYENGVDIRNEGSTIYFKNLTTGKEFKVAEAKDGFKNIQPRAIQKKDGIILVAYTVSAFNPKSGDPAVFPYVMIKQSADNGKKWKSNTTTGLFAKSYSSSLVELNDGSVGLILSKMDVKYSGKYGIWYRTLNFNKSADGAIWTGSLSKQIYYAPAGVDVNQSSIIQLKNGKIIVATRNIELGGKGDSGVIIFSSSNGGQAWTNPKIILNEKYPIRYQLPILSKADNSLILNYRKANLEQKITKRASVISSDNGVNWKDETVVGESELNLMNFNIMDSDIME